MEFILASQSPRREELLKKVVKDFTIIPSSFDESSLKETDPVDFAVKAAIGKAKDVAEKNPSSIVLGSDTVVAVDREILGKPKDLEDARRMLNKLSGQKHKVISGIALYKKDEEKLMTNYEITYTQFKKLFKEEIEAYLATGDYKDKAGSYAVQQIGDQFVEKMEGSYDNVVGLPTTRLKKLLKKFMAEEFIVEITDIALPKNFGVVKKDGEIMFLPNSIPGQKVKVRKAKKKKGVQYLEFIMLMEESPHATNQPCPHSSKCGGCAFQNLSYEKQLELKQNYLNQTLSRIGKVNLIPSPISPSPGSFYYRNKMEYAFGEEDRKVVLGLRERTHPLKKYNRRAVPISECPIFSEQVKMIFPIILDFFNKYKHEKGVLRHLLIREGKNTNQLMVILVTKTKKIEKLEELAKRLIKNIPELKSFYWVTNDQIADVVTFEGVHLIYGEKFIEEKIGELTFRIYPQTFFQPNSKAAELLYQKIKELAALTGKEKVLGLYCGAGAIEICLSSQAKEIAGIDLVEENIKTAEENCKINNITNAKFVCGEVESYLKEPRSSFAGSFDLLVLDPPRSGLAQKAIDRILKLEIPRIIYVSCNPATLARDLKIFQENKYSIKQIAPFDLFPHAAHLETIVQIEK
ncbi:23S rRNA (uracil(1939)-C(5))-methyltransferase RlmD [Candidatus Margulisiibacteriota bacterium]